MSAQSFSESSVVQQPVLGLLIDAGWSYIGGKRLNRPSQSSIIEPDVRAALIKLNPAIAENPDRADEVLARLRLAIIEVADDGLVRTNQKLLSWLRGHQAFQFTDSDVSEPIRLIDFDTPSNNVLVVSDEVAFGPVGAAARFDIVLWVNGFPLVVGEAKTAVNRQVSWFNGARDLNSVYEKKWPQFFVANVLSFATEGREFRYGAVGQDPSDWAMWGSTSSPATLSGWERVKLCIELLLAPATILNILLDYALYEQSSRNGVPTLAKIVPRYPQYEAVEAIYLRATEDGSRRGLVYHTQGSGKTLAMAYAAVKLMKSPQLKNPTLVLIADRVQLVTQTYDQFLTTGMPRIQEAKSTADLRRLLSSDQRGAIFTTVHKFNGAGLLNERENIIVLVDEAHRTQEGSLGDQMRTALPNAARFAFTGTPIADADRNTFKLFGDPADPGWALNTYDSDRSIADGTTVPMHVSGRLVEFNIDQETLDSEFQAMADTEQLSEEDRDELTAKLGKASTFVSNPERISAVCADIVKHFYSTVDPLGMKAQVVVYDRAMCVAYAQEIAAILAARTEKGTDPDEAAVVMTVGGKDDDDWVGYKLSDKGEEDILNRFRNFSDPLKFLIVTSKLGTGFNAPIEGVMYLDKPLKLHTLFQTITRTNRTWKNPATGQEKRYGLIVDYFGLGGAFARAMSPVNPETKQREYETDGLIDVFEEELAVTLERFVGIDRRDNSLQPFQDALNRVPDDKALERFSAHYLVVSGIWESIYPDARLDQHKDDYKWLSQLYQALTPKDPRASAVWKDLGAKTLNLIHRNINGLAITDPGLDAVLADEETVGRLREAGLIGPEVTPTNLLKTAEETFDGIAARIKRRVAGPGGDHIVYKSLATRLEQLRAAQISRANDSIEYLREIFTLAKDLTVAEKTEDELGVHGLDLLDPRVGALTQIFEEFKPEGVPVIIGNVVRSVDDIVRDVRYDGWKQTKRGDKDVRLELRRVLKNYRLPTSGELFDRAYAYISEHY